MNLPYISSDAINQLVDYRSLVAEIKSGFASDQLHTPSRHHHEYSDEDTLLLMPAWQTNKDLGVKVISSNPNNSQYNVPSINGVYLYLDYKTGMPKAILDAKAMTSIRTAGTSALAAQIVANKHRKSMLMIGTGAMAPELIKAHCAVSDIDEVFVWGRDYNKAQALCDILRQKHDFSIKAVLTIAEKISDVDLISAATFSKKALVFGKDLRSGQHVDLVGSYRTDMREADNETMKKSSIFVDSYDGALSSTGDITIPMELGVIERSDIKADLFELCRNQKQGRTSVDSITLFKSVGHGLEDLVAARYFYEKYQLSD